MFASRRSRRSRLLVLFSILLLSLSACKKGKGDEMLFALAALIPKGGSPAPGAVSAPQFNPTAGTYSADQAVTITTATSGAAIHYTTDGTAPTDVSATYSAPISVAGDGTIMTLQAIAVKAGMTESTVATADYTINYAQVSTPQFSPAAGTYSADQAVTITTSTPGAAIHYTTDGTAPTAASATYTTPISVAGNGTAMTIQAIAVKAGMADSTVASGGYVINYQVSTPQFSPAAGTYSADQTVTITTSTAGATIHYTMDGTAPTVASATYSAPISVAGHGTNMTIKALAVKSGITDSTVASADYSILYSADTLAVSADKVDLTVIYAAGDSANSVTRNVGLSTTGANGSTISWSSNNPSVIAVDGTVTRPTSGGANSAVTLIATISRGSASDTKVFNLTVLYSGHTLDGNTVALWRLDESIATQNAADEVGSYPLTQFGNPDSILGQIGRGRLVGGVKYFQKLGDANLGAVFNGNWTYEGWVYLDPAFSTGGIIFIYNGLSFSSSGSDVILAQITADTTRQIAWTQWHSTASTTSGASTTVLQTGQYYHVAVSRTAQGGNLFTYRIYINGQLDATTADVPGLDFPVAGNSHYIGLGCYTDQAGFGVGSAVLNGRLDDVRISNVARSDSEISLSHKQGLYLP